MLSPDDLLHISEGAEEIAEKLHSDIVKRIVNRMMLRIGRGEDYLLTATDKLQIENLQQAGYLLEDIQQDIAKATKLQQTEIAEAMEDAGVKALDYDDKIYQSVGLSPTALPQSPELIRLMQRNYEATLQEWSNFTRTMADEAQRLFINQLDMAYTLVSTGALSYTQAVKEVLNNIVSDGVVVNYPSGHSDTIETATLRAVRTGISQATAQIQVSRMDEMDVDLVITSSHLGARPSHQVWQGKVFSRSGRGKYPPFEESTGYGSVTGLCGANCRHSFSPFFEGMDNPFEQYDSEENRKQYEKEQYQRTLERRIRKTKREVMGLKEGVDSIKDNKAKFAADMDYQKKAALLAKQNKAYQEYCERNNLRPLSDRIQIAKWDRQQAAAARGAAKRYENAHGGSVAKKSNTQIIKPKDIQEANSMGSSMLERLYEEHRISNGLKSTPYSELGDSASKIVSADYGKLSVESATVFTETIESLSAEYDTPLQKIRTMTREEYAFNRNSFAFVSHNYSVDSAELVINPIKCKDKAELAERIVELSQRRYCANISEELSDRYVATHEFAHTLLNMEEPLNDKRNWVGANYKKIKSARKEIADVYEKYMQTVRVLTEEQKALELEAITTFNENAWKKAEEAMNRLNKVKISDYSMTNSDEFLAEAFAQARLGTYQSEYSKMVMEILDKYFRK